MFVGPARFVSTMRMRATTFSIPTAMLALAGLVVLVVLGAAVVGCRTRVRRDTPIPTGVGFELPGSAAVARGALLTEPPGREEAFLPFVAGGATGWVGTCRAEAGGAPPPRFTLETDAHGALRPADPTAGASARDRCLAARAAATGSTGLPAETRVTVQLTLRP
jgi:hypothetical protein